MKPSPLEVMPLEHRRLHKMDKLKLSQITPVSVLLHSPYTLSTYSGQNLTPQMVIAVPCFRSYYQRVADLVVSGEVHQVGDTFYLIPSQQSPRVPKLPSLPIDFDCSVDEWKAMHLPTQSGIYTQ
jgi:hypothetical protein